MPGHVTHREARVWLQLTHSVEVRLRYKREPENALDDTLPWHYTRTALPTRDSAYCHTAVLDSLEPGYTYLYQLVVDDQPLEKVYRLRTPALWQWRSDPPNLRIALGSCTFVNDPLYDRPGRPFGGNYEIFGSIARQQPDMMLWLGDNVYFRESDWGSRAGMLYRHSHTRSLPELQPLLSACPHYAIWDDHDFGPNNSDGTFALKHEALRAFRLFWANPPTPPDLEPGITTTFELGDAQFFLLDGRYHRAPNRRRTGERTLLGKKQLEWLIGALRSSEATFKFVAIGGQVLSPLKRWETYAHYFPEERQQLLDALRAEKIGGVIFLTGDRHQTELCRLDSTGFAPLLDFTVSPLTAGAVPDSLLEPNPLRLPGTLVRERNFALLELRGPRTDRELVFSVLNAQGTFLWQRTLRARELYAD